MNSETGALLVIWYASLFLALASFIVLVILTIRRMRYARFLKDTQDRREFLKRCLYGGIRYPNQLTRDALPDLSKTDMLLIGEVALDVMRGVQGKNIGRVAEMLLFWDYLPFARAQLRNGRRGKKVQALTLIANFWGDDSYQLLLKFAGDKDPYVQLAALQGLAKRHRSQDLPQIFRQLTNSQQLNALMLADVLRQFGEETLPHLNALAASKAQTSMRVAAIIALGNIGSLDSVEPLCALLKDESIDVKSQAALALGEIGDVRAAVELIPLLEFQNKEVRVAAAQSLGLIKAQRAIPALGKALSDDDWWVRFRAGEALYRLGNTGVALLRAMSSQKDASGIIAGQILAEKDNA